MIGSIFLYPGFISEEREIGNISENMDKTSQNPKIASVELTANADIYTQKTESSNFNVYDGSGATPFLRLGLYEFAYDSGGYISEMYIRFNLPQTDNLFSMMLQLTYYTGYPTQADNNYEVNASLVSNNWIEGNTIWTERPEYLNTSTLVYLNNPSLERDRYINLTSLIQGVTDNMITIHLSPSNLTRIRFPEPFYSSESYGITPKLILEYDIPPDSPPSAFILSSNADTPDTDGSFSLTCTSSVSANNYSIYSSPTYITEINNSLTILANQNAAYPHSISGLLNGTYYYIAVAHNDIGNASSNCIFVDVRIESQGDNPSNPLSLLQILTIFSGIILTSAVGFIVAYKYYWRRRKSQEFMPKRDLKRKISKEEKLEKVKEIMEELKNKIGLVDAIVHEKRFSDATNELKSIIDTAKSHNLKEIVKEAEEKIEYVKINKVKKSILELGTKYNRLQISDISEECGEKPGLIISTVNVMIQNKEIYAQYFERSKSVVFNQQANIEEIDKLMELYKEWEEKEIGEKKISKI